jgi:Neugrin
MDELRALHAQDPYVWTTPQLAETYRVSPEAVRRILKSKWRANTDEDLEERDDRPNRSRSPAAHLEFNRHREDELSEAQNLKRRLERGEELVREDERDPEFERPL